MLNRALAREIAAQRDAMVALRRDLHSHPELSFQESRTAGIVAEQLRRAGLRVVEGVAQTGVVGVLEGSQPGKTIAIRADTDALPIEEGLDSTYRSQTPKVMHA